MDKESIHSYCISDTVHNEGDNISNDVNLYGEFAEIYWIWKNDRDCDIVKTENEGREFSLCDSEIKTILKKYNVIAPRKKIEDKCMFAHYSMYVNVIDPSAIIRIVKLLHPGLEKDFNDFMFNQNKIDCSGMAIMRKETFDDVCSFVFPILDKFIDIFSLHDKKKAEEHEKIFGRKGAISLNAGNGEYRFYGTVKYIAGLLFSFYTRNVIGEVFEAYAD